MRHTALKIKDSFALNHFPRKSFLAALFITSLLLAIVGWEAWYSYEEFHAAEARLVRLEELVAFMNTADEVLSMSARMAASTGDLKWEARYLSYEPKLDAAIREARRMLPEEAFGEALARTGSANRGLGKMEKRAFDLVHNGQKERAAALLAGDDYEDQKNLFINAMNTATASIHKFVENTLRGQRKRAFWSFLSIISVFLISIFSWVVVLRLIGRYIAQRNEAENATRESRKELLNITSSVAEGLYVLNKDGNIIFMNPEAERLIGWTQEELEDKNAHSIIHCHDEYGEEASAEECPALKVMRTGGKYYSTREVFRHKDGSTFPVSVLSSPIMENGEVVSSITAFRDITERKRIEHEKEKLIEELQAAISKVKLLSGFLPICASCKKIRDDKGYWNQIESYIRDHSEAEFSHGICPECAKKLYPELVDGLDKEGED